MTLRLQANNASTTLAAGINSAATSLSVVGGTGALFPTLGAGQSFTATLVKNGNTSIYEYVLVETRVTDTFSVIVRGQQNTTALSWNAGDTVALLPTAGDYAQCAQFDDLQQQTGNYAVDTGSANAYLVTVTPAVTTISAGFPLRFKAAHTNTGASTLNGHPLVLQDGSALIAGIITANGVYSALWDGTRWQLEFPDLGSYLTTTAAATTYAPIANPVFTGNPQAPTPALTDSDNSLATTGFVQQIIQSSGSLASGALALPDGTIFQRGVFGGSGVGGVQTVFFPQAFPNGCWSLVASPIGAQSTYYISDPRASNSHFTLEIGAAGVPFSWVAIGN